MTRHEAWIESENSPEKHPLEGKTIGVVGGGPAGADFACYLLKQAKLAHIGEFH